MGQTLCRASLQILGYQPIQKHEYKRINHRQKLVVVISHTSYWDFIILALYMQADPILHQNTHVAINPKPFERWGWFLRPLGCIPTTRAEDQGLGFVDQMVQKFKGKRCRFIMSPEGQLKPVKWRSGHYYLAQGLEADHLVSGVDYERKCLHFGPLHEWSEMKGKSQTEVEAILQQDMGQVVPLHSSRSYTPVTREYDSDLVSAYDKTNVILFVLVLFLVAFLVGILYGLYCSGYKRRKRGE